jgi:nitroreductase
MDVNNAIEERRAYRALAPVEITRDMILNLVDAAHIAPSCFNKQPWNYVFVHDPDMLERMHGAYSTGNEWARKASLVIAVFSRKEADCVIQEREYYLFDTGLATAQMILRATEMGLVAHPIAGFSPGEVRKILGIPEKMTIIALIIAGKRSADTSHLAEHQARAEGERPERKGVGEFVHMNRYDIQNRILR